MTTTKEQCRPVGDPDGTKEVRSSDPSLQAHDRERLPEDVLTELSRIAVRFIEEAIMTARPSTWERRGRDLENARPRPDEYHGQATAEDLAERDQRLAEQAAACREHAELLRRYPTPLTAFERSVVAAIVEGGGIHGDRVDAA